MEGVKITVKIVEVHKYAYIINENLNVKNVKAKENAFMEKKNIIVKTVMVKDYVATEDTIIIVNYVGVHIMHIMHTWKEQILFFSKRAR